MNVVPSPPRRRRYRGFTVFLFFVLVVTGVFAVNFRTVEVKGLSMAPTLRDSQRVLVSHAAWLVGEVKKNDIVVLREADGNGYYIKRVVGLEGDTIDWWASPRGHRIADGKFRVPQGGLYVIGDNLEASEDSRRFGAVPKDRLLGKVLVAR